MKLLIADDDGVTRIKLQALLAKCGHEVVVATDGNDAWTALQKPDAARLALLDWMMPEMDGVEVCRKVRALGNPLPPYFLLVTSLHEKRVVAGLRAGANDYVTKPFDRDELMVRVSVGVQMVQLQAELAVAACAKSKRP